MITIARKFSILILLAAMSFSRAAEPISIQTTEQILKLSQSLAQAYAVSHPEPKLEIAADTLTNSFTALAKKKLQLVVAPRSIRFKEVQACEAALGQRPAEFKLAVNAVAVYVNPANPVKELTYDELLAIFQGKYRNWKKLGGPDAPILAFGVSTNGALGELFMDEVLSGKALTNDVQTLADGELLKTVAREVNGIGFGALAPTNGVRLVEIKRAYSSTPVVPSEETISNRTYPIARFIYGYADAATIRPELKGYLDWVRGEEGQQIARQNGYFPIAAKWRTVP